MEKTSTYFGRDALSFLFVGGTAALLFVAVSSFLFHFSGWKSGVPDWVINGVLYALFVPLVYFSHRIISFRSRTPHRQALTRYLLTQILGLGVATLLGYVCYQVLGLSAWTGSVLVIGITSLFNYVVLRSWAFASDSMDCSRSMGK